MLVREIMSKELVSLNTDNTVQDFISLMEKYYIHEVIVLEKNRLKGSVRYLTLTKKNVPDPSKTKIGTIMDFPPPVVSPDTDIETAAKKLIEAGVRIMPVVEKGYVVGMLSGADIVKNACRDERFKKTAVKELMTYPEVIKKDDELGKARMIMRQANISRLPVVDESGKIAGIVTAYDLLKAIKPRERMNWLSMASEMDRISRTPISVVMSKTVPMIKADESLSSVAKKMLKKNYSGVVITKNSMPIGIVTMKDMLEFYVSGLKREGLYYQIFGIEDEDDFVMSTVERMISDTMKKLSKFLELQYFIVHVKRRETGINTRIKYSIRMRLSTNKGLYISKGYAWDLRDAINQTLKILEKTCKKEREMTRNKSKGR